VVRVWSVTLQDQTIRLENRTRDSHPRCCTSIRWLFGFESLKSRNFTFDGMAQVGEGGEEHARPSGGSHERGRKRTLIRVSNAAIFEQLLPDLKEAHDRQFLQEDALEVFNRLREDLHAAWDDEATTKEDEGRIVKELEAVWPALLAAAYEPVKDFDRLLAMINLKTEPAAMDVDLLGVLGRWRDEVSHTQAIAALMNPSRSGDLGVALLRAFVREADRRAEDWSDAALKQARVLPEGTYEILGRAIRPDVVVHIGEGSNSVLVVVENKVDAKDHENQLDDYARWALAQGAGATLFVYLTPSGLPPTHLKRKHDWKSMSYSQLATAWRRVLAHAVPETLGSKRYGFIWRQSPCTSGRSASAGA